MNDADSQQPKAMKGIGRLYPILYFTGRYGFIFRFSVWLRVAPLVLLLVSWARGWPAPVTALWLVAAVAINWLYGRARRDGFVRFEADEAAGRPEGLEGLELVAYERRVPVRATGIFSLADREEYVLLCPAEYWRVPVNDHIIMVQPRPGRFLYQFFQAATLQEVRAGQLYFGVEARPTLGIRFQVNWGPEFGEDTRAHFVGGGRREPPKRERWMYLSFDRDEDRQLVWQAAALAISAEGKKV